MKTCTKCKMTKPVSEFYHHRLSKDGYSWDCKKCNLASSSAYTATHREQERARGRKYQENHKGDKAYVQRQKEAIARYYKTNPKGKAHMMARLAVKDAIKAGKLIKPNECFFQEFGIDCSGQLEAHHAMGYEPEHYLDVIWLCKAHHLIIENTLRQEQRAKREEMLK